MSRLNDDARFLLDQVDEVRELAKALGKPQLGTSSIESGKIEEYDADGTLTQIIGEQHDGTHTAVTVAGPVPPEPAAPSVTVGLGSAEVRWSGKFADDAFSPMDFSHVSVHASRLEVFGPDNDSKRADISGESGDLAVILIEPGEWTFGLVAVSKAGKWSALSETVTVEIPDFPSPVDIQDELILLDEKYDGVLAEAGNLGARLENAEGDITAAKGRLDEAGTRLDAAFGQISTVDGKATAAATAASSAQSKADTAKSAADQAAADALAASGLAAGKGKVLVQSAAPGAADQNAVTLWIDTTGGANTPKRWTTGTTWVAVTDKAATDAAAAAATAKSAADAAATAALAAQQAAGAAQQTADNALTMAGSKSKVFYSDNQPSGTASANDIWRQVDATKNVIGEWYWAGGWVKTLVSSQAISNLDVGKLTVGTGIISDLVAEHIAGRSARFIQLDVSQLVAVTGTMSEAVITKLFTDVVMSRKITTGMLAVGDFENLAPSLATQPDAWELSGGMVIASSALDETGQRLRVMANTASAFAYGPFKDARPGESFFAEAMVYRSADSTGTAYLRMYWYDNLGANISITNFQQTNTGNAVLLRGAVTAPAGTARARLAVAKAAGSGDTGFYAMVGRRRFGGEVVIDGSLKSVKLDVEDLAANTGFIADLTARIVKSDMFVGNEFVGGVFTGAIFQSSGGGAGFQLTEGGYTSRDEAGNVTVRLPADGSPAQFKGDVEAQSLTASGRVSLQAPENEIASGAKLALEAGVVAPTSAPSVTEAYETTQFPIPPERSDTFGLANTAGLWWRAVNVLGTGTGDRLEALDATGTVKISFAIPMDARNGLTAIGDEIFIFGKHHDRPESERYVRVYKVTSTTATYQREWQYPNYGTGTYQPGIGTDGTNILIAQCWAEDGALTWRLFNKTTGTLISTVNTINRPATDIIGIYQTAADFGTTRVVVARKSGTHYVFSTTGTYQPNELWVSANLATIHGLTYTGGKFYNLTSQNVLVAYSGFRDTDGVASDWWIASSWTGLGGAATPASPARQFMIPRRSGLQISAGDMPAGVTGARIYLARKATTPARADLHLIATVTGSSARVLSIPTGWGSAALPPLTNTFDVSSVAELYSRNGNYKVRGDGSGTWGPLTFNSDGTMSSSAVPAWVPITAYATGFGPQTFGYVPSHRVWPDGKVELRGVIAGSALAKTMVATLPIAAYPAQIVNMVGAANRTSGYPSGTCRVEVDQGIIYVHPDSTGTGITWISLDGIYYYKT